MPAMWVSMALYNTPRRWEAARGCHWICPPMRRSLHRLAAKDGHRLSHPALARHRDARAHCAASLKHRQRLAEIARYCMRHAVLGTPLGKLPLSIVEPTGEAALQPKPVEPPVGGIKMKSGQPARTPIRCKWAAVDRQGRRILGSVVLHFRQAVGVVFPDAIADSNPGDTEDCRKLGHGYEGIPNLLHRLRSNTGDISLRSSKKVRCRCPLPHERR